MTTIEAYDVRRVGTAVQRLAAAGGLLVALPLLRLPDRFAMRAAIQAARLARRTTGRRPLEPEKAALLKCAVEYAARWLPIRVACIETSLATVLAAALLGRQLRWCVGARFLPPPVAYHAWVEIDGHGPIGEDTESGWYHHAALSI